MMRGILFLYLMLAGIAGVLLPLSSLAQESDDFGLAEVDPLLPEKIRKWNADCLSCHSEAGLKSPPRQGMDMKLLATLLVDQQRFEHSDHGKTACKDCHTEAYVPYPHEKNAKSKIKGCVSCHQQPAKIITPEFQASEHFRGHSEKFTCLSCHDSHTMKKASKIGDLTLAAAQDNAACTQCHNDDKRYSELKADKPRPDMVAVHDWLPELDMHLSQVRCIDCHSPVSDLTLSHTVQKKDKAERRCEACHSETTDLGRRLYKKMLRDEPDGWAGFVNAPLLKEIYVVGATRNLWLELGALTAIVLMALLVGGRALWRCRQRKKIRNAADSGKTPPAETPS